MGKKDAEKLMEVVTHTLKNLTITEYHNLLNGNGRLQFVEENTDKYHDVIQTLKGSESYEGFYRTLKNHKNSKTKKQLGEFCNHLRIEIKSKDTKVVLYEKIAARFGYGKEEPSENTVDKEVIKFGKQLQNMQSIKEAEEFLYDQKNLKTKATLQTLAKIYDVHIQSRMTKEEIIKRIIDSVVGSRLKSMVIRTK